MEINSKQKRKYFDFAYFVFAFRKSIFNGNAMINVVERKIDVIGYTH